MLRAKHQLEVVPAQVQSGDVAAVPPDLPDVLRARGAGASEGNGRSSRRLPGSPQSVAAETTEDVAGGRALEVKWTGGVSKAAWDPLCGTQRGKSKQAQEWRCSSTPVENQGDDVTSHHLEGDDVGSCESSVVREAGQARRRK